jgi:hypothetical protein
MKDYLSFTVITVVILVIFYHLALKKAEQDIKDIAILAGKATLVGGAAKNIINGANDLMEIIKKL